MKKLAATVAPVVIAPVVLTAEMIEENANTRQTMWVNFGGVALRFRKLYVAGTERGSVFGLFRTVLGEAYLCTRSVTTPTLEGAYTLSNSIQINGRTFDVYTATNESTTVGLMIDESKRCYRVTRADSFDKLPAVETVSE